MATRENDTPSDPASGASDRDALPETVTHAEVLDEACALDIRDFSLFYGVDQALFEISMRIPKGKVTAIIGPSGCGKSTLLRSINRLNDMVDNVRYAGDMLLHGDSIYSRNVDVIDLRKRMAMVFQRPNPFPMSIFENVIYSHRLDGVRDRHVLADICERSLRVAALWEEVSDRLKSNALSLSDGQKQRLCIARAIAARPEVLLMDEPCSALDPVATDKVENLIDRLRGDNTVMLVTHNMQQAARISDYTGLMNHGRLIEFGPTSTLFTNPRLPETSDYITGRFA